MSETLADQQWNAVLRRLPGGPAHLEGLTDRTSLDGLPRSQAHLLRRAVSSVRGGLEAYPLDLCKTIADLRSFLGSASQDPPLPLGRSLRTELRPILPSDHGWLYLALLRPSRAGRMFGGRTPRPEELPSVIWDNASVVYVVAEPDEVDGHGIVSVSNDHPESGFCTVRATRCTAPEPGTQGIMLDGALQLVAHVFSTMPMRKVYMSIPGWDHEYLTWLADAGLLEADGRLDEHLWNDGRLWAEHRFSLWRESWEAWVDTWSASAPVAPGT